MNVSRISSFLLITVCLFPSLLLGRPIPTQIVAWEDADYLVLVHNSIYDSRWVDELVRRKGEQSLSVAIKQVRDGQTATALKDSVVRAYTTGRVPRYLLLVGDSNGNIASAVNKSFVPTFPINPELGSTAISAYDDKYALLAGNDDIPDLIVGRLPAHSSTEMLNYVNKMNEYEQTSESSVSWKKKVLFVINDFAKGILPTSGFHKNYYRLYARSLFDDFLARHGFEMDPLQGNGGKKATFLQVDDYEYSNLSAGQKASRRWNDFKNELNSGCLIVNVLGVSSSERIADFYKTTDSFSSVSQLDGNGAEYPFFVAPTCDLGRLTGQEVTAARQFLFEASKGAIAWFAAHGGTHSAHTFWLGQEIYNQILEHKVTTLGPATMLAKVRFMEKYPDAKNTAKQFLFFGDPALILSKGSGLSDVAGELPSDRTWGGYTTITGDVIVPTGQTLEIKPYAFVEFENDAELKVYGTLIASGDVFSANADIVFYEGAQVTIPGDLTLPLGAELTIKPGVEVEFLANTDGTGGGRDRTRSELIVEGMLDASAGRTTFRSSNDTPSNDDWYGIRVTSGGTANLSDATIRDGSRCVQNEGGTLTMTNVTLSNCGATVTLDRTPPYAGQPITAELTPPGGITTTNEQWQRRRRSTDEWTNITPETTSAYTPMARDEDSGDEGDEGWQLRATVRYPAEANVHPHAQSAATAPVAGVPSAPQNLMAEAGDESVELTWQTPANNGGADITDYKYRYSSDGGTTWIPLQDEDEDKEGTPLGQKTPPSPDMPHPVGSLTNGETYVFEVWAVNAAGDGPASTDEATPARVPDAPVLTPSVSDSTVILDIVLGAANGSDITRIETRIYSLNASTGDTTWVRADGRWSPSPIDPSRSYYSSLFTYGWSITWGSLTNGVPYTFEVRSVNGVGASAIASVTATPGTTPSSELVSLLLRASAGDGQVVLNWTAPANSSTIADYEVQWRVARSGHGWPGWTEVPGDSSARDTTITGLLNGAEYEFVVQAVDSEGSPVAVSNILLVMPAAVPGVPALTASGGDGQVALRWTASDHSSTIAGYQVRQRISDSGQDWSIWAMVPGGSTARDTTVTGLTNGETYQFQVQAIDSQSTSVAVSNTVSATPQRPLAVEVWFGSATYSAQEGGAGVSITVELSASPSQTLSIPVQVSAEGTEASDYTVPNLTADGTLSLSFTPQGSLSQSFTITANEDADSVNETVSLRFGTLPAGVVAVGTTRQATVTLLDDDDPDGVVSLSSQSPQEDSQLTATLTDASGGISSATWHWQRWSSTMEWENAAGTSLELHPWISIYTPQSGDVGHLLRATVRYTNADGPNQRAESTATDAVRAAPPPTVHLTASGGDGQVALRWTASDHSATIAGYQVRQRISDAGQDWSIWATVPGGISARSKTITGLTNGETYQFQVQAIDSQSTSVAVSNVESATPAGVPDAPPHFMPFPGDGQVVLEWEAAANNGSRITHYEVQWRRVSDPAQAWSSWSMVSGGRSARDTTMTGLTNGQLYEFAVRAVNGVGDGASISKSAMPRVSVVTLSLMASGGDGQVALRWTASAHSATIAGYQVRQRISDAGQEWSSWAMVPGGSTARDTTVTGLTNGETYQFQVQAIDSQGTSVAVSNVESATPQGPLAVEVWFGSATYSAQEGGAGVSITVELSASPSQTLSIPVQVSAEGTEASDYTVPNLTADGMVSLSFGAADRSQSFTITANEDADSVNETVSLRFGTLPAGVVAVGTTRQATVTLLDNDADTAPVFSPADGARETIVGQSFRFTRPPASGGNGSLSYSVSGSCPGLSVTSSSVSGTPSTAGEYGITWTVTDADGDTDTHALLIAVADDTEPMFSSSGTSEDTIVGQSFSFSRPSARGGNGSLSYSVSGTCPGLSVTSSSVSGTPSSSGPCVITWTVRDTDGDTDTYALRLYVAADTSPAFASSGTSESTIVGQSFSFSRPSARGGNGSLSYSVSGTCPGLSVTSSSVSGTPSSSGPCVITWTVRDTDGDTDTYALRLYVAADTSPAFASSGTSESTIVGQSFSFSRPSARGGNGSLSYSVSGTCPGLSVTSSSVSGTPSSSGPCVITWTVRDTDGDTDTYALRLYVAADTSPAFASSGTSESTIVGQSFSFSRPSARGGNGSLSYSVSGTCPGLSVTSSSVSGTPSSSGPCVITWTVRDTDGDTDTYALRLYVAADTSPAFASSGTFRSATVGQSFSFSRPSARGGNGSLSYSVSGTCPGLSVTSSSVSGTPSGSGPCGITWTVTDADGDTDTYTLQIYVAPATAFSLPSGGNGPLSYLIRGLASDLFQTGVQVSGIASQTGPFRVPWTVTDADGDTDTYNIQRSVLRQSA